LTRFFGLGFVDVLASHRHVRHDGHTPTRDFNQPLANRQKIIVPVLDLFWILLPKGVVL
jgi:hypothetical protein